MFPKRLAWATPSSPSMVRGIDRNGRATSSFACSFHDGLRPVGGYDDFVTGWMRDPSAREVWGRPVGLLVLPDGSLLARGRRGQQDLARDV